MIALFMCEAGWKKKGKGKKKLVSFPCEYCKTLFLLAALMPSFHSGPPGIRPFYAISLEVMSDKIFCPCSVQEHFPKFVQRQYGVIFSFFPPTIKFPYLIYNRVFFFFLDKAI